MQGSNKRFSLRKTTPNTLETKMSLKCLFSFDFVPEKGQTASSKMVKNLPRGKKNCFCGQLLMCCLIKLFRNGMTKMRILLFSLRHFAMRSNKQQCMLDAGCRLARYVSNNFHVVLAKCQESYGIQLCPKIGMYRQTIWELQFSYRKINNSKKKLYAFGNRIGRREKKRRRLQLNHVNTPFYKYLMLPALEIEAALPRKKVSTEIKYISWRRKFFAIKIKKWNAVGRINHNNSYFMNCEEEWMRNARHGYR